MIFMIINAVFCLVQTEDIDYQPRYYVVSKRISKVALGNLLTLMLMTSKNDLLGAISGLQHDRLAFLHKWLGRYMFAMISLHFAMACVYWLGLDFPIMLMIPPQIFGFIAYGSLLVLTFGSLKLIRKLSYDFFIVQHKIFSFIMLLLAYFHNKGNAAAVLISVHLIVVDRILSKVVAFIHKRKSPTKAKCSFEKLDDETIAVTIPVKLLKFTYDSWYSKLLPKIGYWKPGQHIVLNVPKVNFFQMHPFTIASLPDSKHIKLIIRMQKGFTKRLMKKMVKLQEEDEEEGPIVKLKATFHGPYGGHFQSLLPFDTSLFFGAGSGCAFIFPVTLDLLRKIKEREEQNDYLHRPENAKVHIVWAIKKKENVSWIKHLHEELSEFIRSGKLTMDLYMTQEQSTITTESTYIEEESSPRTKHEIKSNYIEVDSSPHTSHESKELFADISTTSSSISEVSILDLPGVKSIYSRPNIPTIIGKVARSLVNENGNTFKALAVCSCGPPRFTNEIKVSCQANRKLKNPPDVYCYTESF
ncbi:ferric reductase NAD binding domain-containing protein [Scheffersomyces coipomensis]|uniref:ferric reductase NAD binding domain-containing protein n=1 Tax=Scheffersomyces coipomensis TaxID=1788519 RepID=UPI00315CF31E